MRAQAGCRWVLLLFLAHRAAAATETYRLWASATDIVPVIDLFLLRDVNTHRVVGIDTVRSSYVEGNVRHRVLGMLKVGENHRHNDNVLLTQPPYVTSWGIAFYLDTINGVKTVNVASDPNSGFIISLVDNKLVPLFHTAELVLLPPEEELAAQFDESYAMSSHAISTTHHAIPARPVAAAAPSHGFDYAEEDLQGHASEDLQGHERSLSSVHAAHQLSTEAGMSMAKLAALAIVATLAAVAAVHPYLTSRSRKGQRQRSTSLGENLVQGSKFFPSSRCSSSPALNESIFSSYSSFPSSGSSSNLISDNSKARLELNSVARVKEVCMFAATLCSRTSASGEDRAVHRSTTPIRMRQSAPGSSLAFTKQSSGDYKHWV